MNYSRNIWWWHLKFHWGHAMRNDLISRIYAMLKRNSSVPTPRSINTQYFILPHLQNPRPWGHCWRRKTYCWHVRMMWLDMVSLALHVLITHVFLVFALRGFALKTCFQLMRPTTYESLQNYNLKRFTLFRNSLLRNSLLVGEEFLQVPIFH